ncbi:Membrane-bound lytic murein transglycosylase F [Methylobacterium adhaesivum]|uniref:Phage tail tape measure protein n=1 Tax=Methylobacterium adhaesivum TaxID=333297 RepID=A0ABT8BLS8_9HYPH|nr:phage tail tape measure protein [Methylobacterium adhaesivum]MDN3592490.1 phage tail tape measure protein [Methylobacterium adhaesivum]GJD32832.1 Membrane-bound lytic murein transglycosylase F [Methylobacterium adhaesivum]
MADGTQIDVDIVLDDATLNTGLARTAQHFREAVIAARGLSDQFSASTRTVEPLLNMVTNLRAELAASRADGGLQSGLRDQLRTAEADLRTATAALTAARAAASAPAPGSGQGGAGGSGVPPLSPGGSPAGGAGGAGGLFPLQAQIAANYATIGAGITMLRAGLKDIAEFDDKLRQFQAITETTNTELGSFRDQLLAVAATSRFSLTELANVSIQLGQIGLSARGVGQTLKPVLDLAAASGSTLQQSVEAITSVLGAYNIEAARSGDVADVFVGALNRTKLGMEQLQLGVSYAANVARDSGVSFTELTAALGGMAQAGIKSGSTLGTGLRQFFQEFTAPTDKLKDGLRQVGLSMADVDLKANGLIGVIENLRKAGFGGAEALRSLDLRAASAYSAMLGQVDVIKRLGGDLTLSNAAAEGAAKANESLTASLTRFGNVSFALLDRSLRPMVSGLTGAVDGAAALADAAGKLGIVLPVVGTGLGTIAVAAAGLRLGTLAASLAPLLAGLANPAVLALAAAGAAIAGGAYLARIMSDTERAKDALDQVRAIRNEVLAQQQSIETGISGVDQQLGLLMERREKLNADPVLRRNTILEAQKAFGDLGLTISANAASIDELVAAYRRLRTELQGQNTELLQRQFAVTAKELDALVTKGNVDRRGADQRIADALGSNAPEFSDPRFPTAAPRGSRSDDAGLARAGLTALKPLLDVIRNPASLGGDDPLGVSRYQQIVLDERQRLEREAAPLRLDGSNTGRLAAITDNLDKLDKIAVLFSDAVKTNAGTIAAQGKLTELSSRADVSRLQQTPEFQAFGQRAADLQANLTERSRSVTGSGTERKAGIVAAIRDTQAEAASLEAEFNRYLGELRSAGAADKTVTEAGARITDQLKSLRRGVTKELDEIAASIRPDLTRELQAERKNTAAQIDTLMKRAGATRDTAEPGEIEAQVKALVERQRSIARKLIEAETANPDEVDSRPELKERLAQANEELDARLAGYADRVAEARKRITESLLASQERALGRQKGVLDAQVAQLNKQIRDPATTVDKAAELAGKVRDLIQQGVDIVDRQASLRLAREAVTAPTGFNRAPALGEEANAVARQVADAAEGAGRNDRLRTLLRFGAFESDFNPRAVSSTGARGVYQFTKGTAADYGLSDPTNVAQSALAAIRYFDAIDKTLRGKGLNLSDDNRYVLYNQGETGGSALLANPGKGAVQALMDAGVNAARARQAITANGGREGDTSSEFTTRLLAAFNAKATRADRLVIPTGDALDEGEAAGRKARAEAATVDEANARAIRQKRLALQQRQLARDEQGLSDQLALDRRAVGRTADLAPATRTITDLAALRDKDLEREKTSDRFTALAPDEQGDQVARIQRSYADRAAKLVEENAKAIGEATLKTYREEADRTKARADYLKADETAGKVSAAEVQAAEAAARQAAERLKLEGQAAAIRAEELALETQLGQLRDKGLVSETGRAAIQERITELKKREGEYAANASLQKGVEARGDDYGAALSRGSLDFFTSAGMIDRKTGEFKTAAQQMSGYWQQSMSGMSTSMATLFQGLATGTIKGKDAFKTFATSILTDMAQIASKAASNEIMKSLFGDMSGGGSGVSSAGGISSILGNLFSAPAAPGMATGGLVTGGVPNRDSVPRTLMPGEFVLKRSAVDVIGRESLDRMNAMGAGVMAKAPPVEPTRFGSSARAETSVYVVDRDQVPVPSRNEIVHMIGDDIQRGGAIRQLVKRVAAGI